VTKKKKKDPKEAKRKKKSLKKAEEVLFLVKGNTRTVRQQRASMEKKTCNWVPDGR